MGYFYRPTREEIIAIKRKADTWKSTTDDYFGFYKEPIVTEEGRHYTFYEHLETGVVYVDDIGKKHGGFDMFLFEPKRIDTDENLKKALLEIVEKAKNGEKVYYPD